MVDKEDLYIFKSNCKGERTVGKANKGINGEEIIIGLKNKKLKLKKRGGGKKVQSGLMPGSSQSIYSAHELTKIKKFMV